MAHNLRQFKLVHRQPLIKAKLLSLAFLFIIQFFVPVFASKTSTSCGLALSCVLLSGCQNPTGISRAYENNGVILGFGDQSTLAIDDHPPGTFISHIQEPLPDDEFHKARFLDTAFLALGRYPPDFWGPKIPIVIASTNFESNGGFFGFHTPEMIVFDRDGKFTEQSFHHELAHRIHSLYGSEDLNRRWRMLTIRARENARHNQNSIEPTRSQDFYLQRGFVSLYAMSNTKEDLAEMAAHMMMGSRSGEFPDFWEEVERSPVLQAKVELVVELYHQADPRFTLDFFFVI